MSKHESLAHINPYYLLFGRLSLLDRSVSDRMRQQGEHNLDDEKAWVQMLAEREEQFIREMPMAMRNQATAQARDCLRYVYTRGGTNMPKPKQYRVGDFVHVKRRSIYTLDCGASPIILLITQIKSDHMLVRRGQSMTMHARVHRAFCMM